MDGKKVFFVGLVLLAGLFAVGAVLAARKDGDARAREHEPSPFEKALGAVLRPMRPRAKLPAASFSAGSTAAVPPSEDEPMRMAAFRIGRGCLIKITYRTPLPKPDTELDEQVWPPPDGPPKDPERTSFVVLKEGGTFTFNPCTADRHAQCRVFVVED